ncbi:hypothetical protein KUTeg_010918 [Tegillarca granosa]|uniref:methionyl-tRNA formyltransferase n=1 Tax=Tegillarca granosa TaxID=220873 RepID=A0ABQ9F7F9_TEGGR|nr:hypothetical protein KUTeg_010918 [Tegillarca granosa]
MLCEMLCGVRQRYLFKPFSSIDRLPRFCFTSKVNYLMKEQNVHTDTEYKVVHKFEIDETTNFTGTCKSCESSRRLKKEQTGLKLYGRKHFVNNTKKSVIFGKNLRFFHLLQTQKRQFCNAVDKNGHQAARTGPPWRVLFLGSDYFALYSLKALVQNRNSTHNRVVDNLEVVVPNFKKSEITKYAIDMGLVIHDWPIDVPYGRYDVGVVTSFGKLIPKKIIENIPHGIINVHGSLLPRWRGAAPIAHAIYNRDKVTGITIMKIKPKHFDIGEILMKREIPIPEHVTALELGHIMAPIGADMVIETLSDLVNLENKAVEQPSEGATRVGLHLLHS